VKFGILQARHEAHKDLGAALVAAAAAAAAVDGRPSRHDRLFCVCLSLFFSPLFSCCVLCCSLLFCCVKLSFE
jgi:hypothetical protein